MDANAIKKSTSDSIENLKNAARSAAAGVQRNFETGYQRTRDGVVTAGKATHEYVHDNPWTVVGVAMGIGFLLGLLVNWRR